METRHVVRCLRSNPSSSISAIARRHNNSSTAQQPCFRSQNAISSIPSSRRYLSSSESQQPPSESQKGSTDSSEAKADNPTAQSSQPSPSSTFGDLGQSDSTSNARKLGDVSDILDQLGMRKPKPQSRATDMTSLFPETRGPIKSPSIAQLSERVKSSLSRSDPFTPPKVNLRLGPSLGRTVAVDHGRGFDVTRAVRSMEGLCGRNKVRVQERDQRFHLRRGQKRKDMKSQRWRKLFNASFQKTLLRCHRMRQQGW